MNVSCDSHDQLSLIQKKRIKTRSWYVKVMLQVSDITDDPDYDVAQCIKKFWTLLIRKEI